MSYECRLPQERYLFCSACEPGAAFFTRVDSSSFTEWACGMLGAWRKKMSWLLGNLGNFVILCYNIGEGVEDHAWFIRVGLRSRKIC